MNRVALIPARGGSKRLPRKNIIPFQGKPIIANTIEAAKQTGLFDRILVSTEDEEIADISRKYGADIASRDSNLASDEATVTDVCVDFLTSEESLGRMYDVLCVLYATAPLRNTQDIKHVTKLIDPGVCDYALAITQYDLPPHQALKLLNDGAITPMWPDLVSARADAIGDLRVDNGSTYVVSVQPFLETRTFYGPNLRGYEMPRERSVDIDTRDDYDLASYYAGRNKL